MRGHLITKQWSHCSHNALCIKHIAVYLCPNIFWTPLLFRRGIKIPRLREKETGGKENQTCIILRRTSRALSITFIIICSNIFSQEPACGVTAWSALRQVLSPLQQRQELWQTAGGIERGIARSVLIRSNKWLRGDNGGEKFSLKAPPPPK